MTTIEDEARALTGQLAELRTQVRRRTGWVAGAVVAGAVLALLVAALVLQLKATTREASRAAHNAQEAAEANQAVLERIDRRFDGVLCYVSHLTGEPPPAGVTCP